MLENFRDWLYYPLGMLPSIFFSLRFILQWLKSERLKTSHISAAFWKLSICGNILATLHYFIQMQYLFFFIQFINSFISRRNLVIMGSFKNRFSLKVESGIFLIFLLMTSSAFFFYCGFDTLEKTLKTDWALHFLGICGGFLFASRFWLQWWTMEKNKVSTLNKHFWMLSIFGGLLTIAYTLFIEDRVSLINYCCGMVPYVRNLVLLRNEAKRNTAVKMGM